MAWTWCTLGPPRKTHTARPDPLCPIHPRTRSARQLVAEPSAPAAAAAHGRAAQQRGRLYAAGTRSVVVGLHAHPLSNPTNRCVPIPVRATDAVEFDIH
eukprot:1022980-Prymnesium_polylepis.1